MLNNNYFDFQFLWQITVNSENIDFVGNLNHSNKKLFSIIILLCFLEKHQ